jgi:non-ribosomal peptide synthetase component E (peptide arylation enzyme)
VPDATLGERVAAIVQLSGNGDATALDRILASAGRQLADYKVPETMKAVSMIPRNAVGKIDRASLPALL